MLVLGEIRTCLLHNSASVPRTAVLGLLGLIPGERVRVAERPIARAVSPEAVTGVDCRLPTASGARSRGVGTVAARAVVTGGRVLQSSVRTRIERGDSDRRLPWSHYLSRPGVVETIGRADLIDIASGFVADPASSTILDLGAVSERLVGTIQMNSLLDHTAPFRSRRTRMRWAAEVADDGTAFSGDFAIESDVLRTFRLTLAARDLPAVQGLCEDLAFHDWVLTTLLTLVERSRLGSTAGPEGLGRLRPVIDHLLHLWMPGGHVDQALLPMWESLERRPGFTRQWQTTVAWIRDQLALHTLTALGELRTAGSDGNQSGGFGDAAFGSKVSHI